MPLVDLIQEHRLRKKKDEKAIMTMVIKKSKPSPFTNKSRLGTDQLFIALDPLTKQLLYCDEDKIGNIHSSYAARVDNFRSYDTVSKDIIQRWTYPYVPDINFSGNRPLKLGRQGIYGPSDAIQSQSAHVGSSTIIGYGTKIGSGDKILNSVIGNGCCIGSNVVIQGSYIWSNVTIEDGCVITNAIVCDGVKIRAGAVVHPGVVLSFKVVVGRGVVVPAYSKVSLLEQPTEEDSDEELEYADSSRGTANVLSGVHSLQMESKASDLGPDRAGHIWKVCEGAHYYEEWLYSVAPIPMDKLAEIMNDDDDTEDESVVLTSGELKSDADSINTDVNDPNDDYGYFEREVEATFLRAVEDGNSENLVMEITDLWKSHNRELKECAAAIEVIQKWEEMCQESPEELGPWFARILHLLYDKGVLPEDAILRWAEEQAGVDDDEKIYLNQC
ncbi:unnamed protein product [Arabis nemorensis]|uniref:W2 domain-containing protein n=1 Tax=Arabis nemorensis TaxID=586526 RepID=A0A565B0M2_9BRAS|nr:unnamed protein product [Arabis nemorensis]